MSGYLKYKTKDRYSMGWTDPRGIFGQPTNNVGIEGIKIGDYYLGDLFRPSEDLMDIYHNGYICRAKKEEFAACIEAFLKEKKDGESNTVQGGNKTGLEA